MRAHADRRQDNGAHGPGCHPRSAARAFGLWAGPSGRMPFCCTRRSCQRVTRSSRSARSARVPQTTHLDRCAQPFGDAHACPDRHMTGETCSRCVRCAERSRGTAPQAHSRRPARGELSMGTLVERLSSSQPLVSKHLRVLREAGLVEARVDGQRRLYRLQPQPLAELDAWLAPYRRVLITSLDRLEAHLTQPATPPAGRCASSGVS